MKNLLTKALSHTAQMLPFRYWQGLWGDKLFLPFYHLVSDESPPHVRQLYPVRTERQFREDLDFLLKHFQPIDLQTLWEHVFEKRAFDRPVFHLSFDDGLRECHEVVIPILLEKGIPASFFLNPDFIDNQGLMFRYKASLLSVAHLQGVPHFPDPLAVKYENRHLLDTWAEAIGLDFAAFLVDQKPYLSTVQIQDMQAKGFTFGAHSLDHPQYGQIPLEEQIRQTVQSLSEVKSCFGVALNTFAFPFTDDGVGLEFFNTVQEKLGEPLLSFGSASAKRDEVPTHLQRFAMERTLLPARNVVSAELAKAVMRRMLGRNVVRRQHFV
ncbi:MAG: polysaccharide deacetylase family protein [Saprospiraceae bacterium]|nr:polysaccharide deacetylase family protein [Saprospiraceae bacterium]